MQIIIFLFSCLLAGAQEFCFVELNCENLFDTTHDSLKQDAEFTKEGSRHWTRTRYWNKQNNIAREIISCGGNGAEWHIPDLVALIEIENDSVMHDLTRRSLLRNAGYNYVMTCSNDVRGIDVALLYNPFTFHLDSHYSIRIENKERERPTRDILYVKGFMQADNDTVMLPQHIFVVHAPSRSGGKSITNDYRLRVADRLCQAIDSISNVEKNPRIIVAGDFNDYYDDESVKMVTLHGMKNVSAGVKGKNGAKGTYRFRGEWGSLDQIMVSDKMLEERSFKECFINDADFLLEDEKQYGGKRPHRTYSGPKYDARGFSDHLPLVLRMK